jgi:hypothetical protein
MFSFSGASSQDGDLPFLHAQLNRMTLSSSKSHNSPSLRSDPAMDDTNEQRELPGDFQPTPYSVICAGRRHHKTCLLDSVGNRRFRVIASMFQNRYAAAQSSLERSQVVTQIIDIMQSAGGGFVKYDTNRGKWYEVSETMAREMVQALLRDCLVCAAAAGSAGPCHDRPFKQPHQFKAARRKSHQSLGDETVSTCTTTQSDQDLTNDSERSSSDPQHQDTQQRPWKDGCS